MSDGEGGAADLHGRPDPAIGGGRRGPAVSMGAMRQEFLDFFDAEYHLLVRFMMRKGASLDKAEDAAQEAFKRGWEKVQHGQWPQITNPLGWIRIVALRQYQPQGAVLTGQLPDTVGPGPGHAELTGQALDVVAALKLIDDENARAVVALDMDGIPGPAIAAMLDLTEQQVRDLRKKARRMLKKQLAPPSQPTAFTTQPASIEGGKSR